MFDIFYMGVLLVNARHTSESESLRLVRFLKFDKDLMNKESEVDLAVELLKFFSTVRFWHSK